MRPYTPFERDLHDLHGAEAMEGEWRARRVHVEADERTPDLLPKRDLGNFFIWALWKLFTAFALICAATVVGVMLAGGIVFVWGALTGDALPA